MRLHGPGEVEGLSEELELGVWVSGCVPDSVKPGLQQIKQPWWESFTIQVREDTKRKRLLHPSVDFSWSVFLLRYLSQEK